MNNPYYEEFKEMGLDASSFLFFPRRDSLVKKYSWAVPNEEAITAIANLNKPVIEMGAGGGYWASLIDAAGVDIICFDKKDYATHFKVHIGSFEVLNDDKYNDHALMLCWPTYDEPFAFDCLAAYKGDTVIYIGEGHGGCTGDAKFHELLDEKFECDNIIDIPTYLGIYDRLYILKGRV